MIGFTIGLVKLVDHHREVMKLLNLVEEKMQARLVQLGG